MDNEMPAYSFFRFEDLRIYDKALDYANWVHTHTQQFPEKEQVGIAARFDVKAQSIAIHIAEGSGRNRAQFIHYLKMAKTGIRECIVLTAICFKFDLLSKADVEESRNFLIEMSKMIGALITSLHRTGQNQGRPDPNQDNNIDFDDTLPADYGNVM